MQTKYSHLNNQQLSLLLRDQMDKGVGVEPELLQEVLNRLEGRIIS